MEYFDLSQVFNEDKNRCVAHINLLNGVDLKSYNLFSLNKISIITSNLPSFIVPIEDIQVYTQEELDNNNHKFMTPYYYTIFYKINKYIVNVNDEEEPDEVPDPEQEPEPEQDPEPEAVEEEDFNENEDEIIDTEGDEYELKQITKQIYFINEYENQTRITKRLISNDEGLYKYEVNNNDTYFMLTDINDFISQINNQIKNDLINIFNEVDIYKHKENLIKVTPSLFYDYSDELLKFYYPVNKYNVSFVYNLNPCDMLKKNNPEEGYYEEDYGLSLCFNKQFYNDFFKTQTIINIKNKVIESNRLSNDNLDFKGDYTFKILDVYMPNLLNIPLSINEIEENYAINCITEDYKTYGSLVKEINIFCQNVPLIPVNTNISYNNSFKLINNNEITQPTGEALLTKLIINNETLKLTRLDYTNNNYSDNSIKLLKGSWLQSIYIHINWTDKYGNCREMNMNKGDSISLLLSMK